MIQEPLNDRALRTTYILRRDARAIRNNLKKKKSQPRIVDLARGIDTHNRIERECVCIVGGV